MTIRKIPKDNRRLKRIESLIFESLMSEVRSRYLDFNFKILKINIYSDLKKADIFIFSDHYKKEDVLSRLQSLRLNVQNSLSSYGLRYTPVLNFIWDSNMAHNIDFFNKLKIEAKELGLYEE